MTDRLAERPGDDRPHPLSTEILGALRSVELRGNLGPQTLDREARTAQARLYSGATVDRYSPQLGEYRLALSTRPGDVDLSRANEGTVALMPDHPLDGSVREQLGAIVRGTARTDLRDGVTAVVAFTDAAPIHDIARGALGALSVVADIDPDHVVETTKGDGPREFFAGKWALREVGLVSTGADPRAAFLSHQQGPSTMEPKTDTPNTTAPDANAIALAERERVTAIRDRCEKFGIDKKLRDELVNSDLSAQDAAARILDEVAKRDTETGRRVSVGTDYDSAEERRKGMSEALAFRMSGASKPSDRARPFAEWRVSDHAAECLQRHTGRSSLIQRSPARIVREAFHATSDFPLLFGDAMNRSLLMAYQSEPVALKVLSRQSTASDFRTKHTLRLGQSPGLELMPEGSTYRLGTLAESEETYAVKRYGRQVRFSFEAITNDDLDGISRVIREWGKEAAETEGTVFMALLSANSGAGQTMSEDSKAIFHVDHGNYVASGSGAVPSIDTISAGRLALRTMKGLARTGSQDPTPHSINARATHIVVPAALETTTEQLLSLNLNPNASSEVVPFTQLELLVDSRLDDLLTSGWYMVASGVECLEHSYLDGDGGPVIETEDDWDSDGLKAKVRLVFGAAFLDYRGWYFNYGA